MVKLFLPLVCFVAVAKAQDSPNALGAMVFKAFKENKLELLFESRLKEPQLDSFFIWLGKDITTDNYKRYKSKYKSITQKFIDSCQTFEMDIVDSLFSWKTAELVSIKYKPSTSADNAFNTIAPAGETTMLQLFIKCNGLDYIFITEIFPAMDKKWHLGNTILRHNGNLHYPWPQ